MASGEMCEIHGEKHKILALTLLSFLLWVTITLNPPMSTFILPLEHPYYSLLEASPLHLHLPNPMSPLTHSHSLPCTSLSEHL